MNDETNRRILDDEFYNQLECKFRFMITYKRKQLPRSIKMAEISYCYYCEAFSVNKNGYAYNELKKNYNLYWKEEIDNNYLISISKYPDREAWFRPIYY